MSDKQFEQEKKKYIKEINSYLICDCSTRNKFIRDLKSDIDEYIESKSITDFSLVSDHFGEPRDIAKGFLENADTKKIKKKMNMTRVVVTAVIIALVMCGICLFAEWIDTHESNSGYSVIEMGDASLHTLELIDLGDFI